MYLSKDIIMEGNPILRLKSTKVNLPLSSDDLNCAKGLYEYVIVSAVDELVEKYKIRPGVGIAAPQVGINKRMFAINCTDFLDENQKQYAYLFINPLITYKSKEMVYLGYEPWPWSGLNGESLLYNSTPQDDPENPLANVLVAAPISAGGERVVAFYRDYSADEYRIHYIKEREFSKYWTTNEKKELVWRKEE